MQKISSYSELAGCIYNKGTYGIQTIKHRNTNPFMYDLLTLLQEETGLKALVNTSFSAKRMPVVHNTKDAIN
ncbi:MAG: carbamoyltransferase C-terminal domain-containing protein [Bacteroidia bacterium]